MNTDTAPCFMESWRMESSMDMYAFKVHGEKGCMTQLICLHEDLLIGDKELAAIFWNIIQGSCIVFKMQILLAFPVILVQNVICLFALRVLGPRCHQWLIQLRAEEGFYLPCQQLVDQLPYNQISNHLEPFYSGQRIEANQTSYEGSYDLQCQVNKFKIHNLQINVPSLYSERRLWTKVVVLVMIPNFGITKLQLRNSPHDSTHLDVCGVGGSSNLMTPQWLMKYTPVESTKA